MCDELAIYCIIPCVIPSSILLLGLFCLEKNVVEHRCPACGAEIGALCLVLLELIIAQHVRDSHEMMTDESRVFPSSGRYSSSLLQRTGNVVASKCRSFWCCWTKSNRTRDQTALF